ncbi:HipA domain-containing protein [Sanguibacter sp. A247]|uniref:HipA domain-containing protein n=1 Tax=unclassified Sanguibacter TaxID=2645534 RepID=UPI003FD740DC
MTALRQLDVYLRGYHAAVISRSSRGLVLDYERDYVESCPDWPLSYSLPMTTRRHSGPEVAAFLDNLMPDNGEVTREWARIYGARSTDPFDLLWFVGADCAGAATFFPRGTDPVDRGALSPIGEAAIAQRIKDLRERPSGWTDSSNPGQFSLGGAQSKFALALTQDGWVEPTGVHPSTHIFKTGIPKVESSDVVEYLTMRVARAVSPGIAELEPVVAEVYLLPFEDQRALVVERFDREIGPGGVGRVHTEDICQMLGLPSLRKYESYGGPGISGTLGALDRLPLKTLADASKNSLLQALVFNWVIGGTDAHAKNYSVFVGPEGRLAPLYDLTSYAPYTASVAACGLPMKIDGNRYFGDVMPIHWRALARDVGVDRRTIMDLIEAMTRMIPAAWAAEMATLAEPLLTPVVLESATVLTAWCDQIRETLSSEPPRV